VNRIHFAGERERWRWPVDNEPIIACEVRGPSPQAWNMPPLAKRIEGVREFSSDPDAVTCRICRRTSSFHEARRIQRRRIDAVPRMWHSQETKAQRRRARSQSRCYRRQTIEQERVRLEIEAAAPRIVPMWRTRAARDGGCMCPMHVAKRARAERQAEDAAKAADLAATDALYRRLYR
jgi:hypothetical protein